MYKNQLPVVPESGFKMDGYYVWCGSAIVNEKNEICLFAARWPKDKSFPNGYMTDSEIVLGMTDDPAKPFSYKKTIIDKRPGGYWDSMMAHNPFILKIQDKYVLYYIGTPDGQWETRKIGYAWADSLEGPWHRAEKAIDLPDNANNPAPLLTPEGKILLYFRDGNLKVSVAEADRFDGEYVVKSDNLFPEGKIEDMFGFYENDRYFMLAEDADGAYTGLKKGGVLFESADGIHWVNKETAPAYDFHVQYADGTARDLDRRERPFLLHFQDRLFLLNGAKINGDTRLSGGDTWNMIQELYG